MKELQIHSQGHEDHLIAIKERFTKLKNALKRNIKMNENEKQTELKKIEEQFSKEHKESNQNLY